MVAHEIPREKKNETRIFVIFSIRSLASTVIGVVIGALLGLIINLFKIPYLPYVLVGIFGLIGFLVGTVPIIYIPGIPVTKEVQGEYLYNVLLKYSLFKQRRSLKVMIEED